MIYSAARIPAGQPRDRLREIIGYLDRQPAVEATGDPGAGDAAEGVVTFPGAGTCFLTAPDHLDHLDLLVRAPGPAALARTQDAVAAHLRGLVGRDTPGIGWSPVVRPASAADDPALLDLDRVSWTPGSGIPSIQRRERQTFFSEALPVESFLVAERAGTVLGYVGVRRKAPFEETAHVFALWSLVVAVPARRLGVASALLVTAERVAADQGASKLCLRVLGSNPAAQRLYRRHGYTVEGCCAGEFLIDGEYVDDLTMAKYLRTGPEPR